MNNIDDYTEEINRLWEAVKNEFEKDQERIELNHVTLKEAMTTQTHLQLKWERFSSEISNLVLDLEQKTEEVYAKVYDELINDRYKDVNTQQAKHGAMANDHYISWKILYNESIKLKTDVEAIVSTVRSRQYTLNKLSDLIINSVEQTII